MMTYTVMTMIYEYDDDNILKIAQLQLALDHAIEENRRLKESQENTVKMLKVVLGMLDKKMHL